MGTYERRESEFHIHVVYAWRVALNLKTKNDRSIFTCSWLWGLLRFGPRSTCVLISCTIRALPSRCLQRVYWNVCFSCPKLNSTGGWKTIWWWTRTKWTESKKICPRTFSWKPYCRKWCATETPGQTRTWWKRTARREFLFFPPTLATLHAATR